MPTALLRADGQRLRALIVLLGRAGLGISERSPFRSATSTKQLHRAAAAAGVRRRFAAHQMRRAHAVEMAHEGVPLVVIQRQLGHANLGITSVHLQGIDSSEIIDTFRASRAKSTARPRYL